MRLRRAIKIMRFIHGEKRWKLPHPNWKLTTIWEARKLCRRKWRDNRVPFIPTDDEMTTSFGFCLSVIGEALIDAPDELDEFKEQIWRELESVANYRSGP